MLKTLEPTASESMVAITVYLGSGLTEITRPVEELTKGIGIGMANVMTRLMAQAISRIVRYLDQPIYLINRQPQGTGPSLMQTVEHVVVASIDFAYRVKGILVE